MIAECCERATRAVDMLDALDAPLRREHRCARRNARARGVSGFGAAARARLCVESLSSLWR